MISVLKMCSGRAMQAPQAQLQVFVDFYVQPEQKIETILCHELVPPPLHKINRENTGNSLYLTIRCYCRNITHSVTVFDNSLYKFLRFYILLMPIYVSSLCSNLFLVEYVP